MSKAAVKTKVEANSTRLPDNMHLDGEPVRLATRHREH